MYDCAGQEKYKSHQMAATSDVSVLMFDLTNNVSHTHLSYWHKNCCNNEPVIVVGAKSDCADIKVEPTYHMKHNLPYLEVSAKTMTDFRQLVTTILRSATGYDDLVLTE